LCSSLFDATALSAWDEAAQGLTQLAVSSHVGLAWDRAHGYRLKLFIGRGPELPTAAAWLGLQPTTELAGVGCDFWAGGRYRPRRYLRANGFAALAQLAAPEPVPAWSLPAHGHAMLTLTEPGDALGQKTTFSVIFPPTATLSMLAELAPTDDASGLDGLAARLAPFVLRPSALELDRYRGGREQLELLLTLGARPA
jgi:hypothetical protein